MAKEEKLIKAFQSVGFNLQHGELTDRLAGLCAHHKLDEDKLAWRYILFVNRNPLLPIIRARDMDLLDDFAQDLNKPNKTTINHCQCNNFEPMTDEQECERLDRFSPPHWRQASDVVFCGRKKHPFCNYECLESTASPKSLQILSTQAILFQPGSSPKEWRRWTTTPPGDQGCGSQLFPVDDGLKDFLNSLRLPDKLKNELEQYYNIHCMDHHAIFREKALYGNRCKNCNYYRARAEVPPHVDVELGPSTAPLTPRWTTDGMWLLDGKVREG